jgi:hypothetical protein
VWFYLNPKNSFYRGIRDKNWDIENSLALGL